MEHAEQMKVAIAAVRALKNQRNEALDRLADKSAECDILAGRITELQKETEKYARKFEELSQKVSESAPAD